MTTGKRLCHIGIEGFTLIENVKDALQDVTSNPDVVIKSEIKSHELRDDRNIMLFSLNAQQTMCLVKDMTAGHVYMQKEELWIQLYRIQDTL